MMKQNPFSFSLSFFFFFLIHLIPIFRKGGRKNSLKLYLSLTRLNFQVPFFYGRATSPESAESALSAVFCPKDSVLIFLLETFSRDWLNWCLSLANVCPELNFLFQISSNEKMAFFGLRVSGPIIWLFPTRTIPSGYDIRVTWISFFIQQIRSHGVLVVLIFILLPF